MSLYASVILGTAGLVSYWRLGEPSGTNAADAKGSNTGTYTGGITLAQTGALVGDSDTAALLNGTTGWVSVADNATLDRANGAFTIEAWCKRVGTTTNQGIVSKGTGAYYFRWRSDDRLNLLRDGQADIAVSSAAHTDTTNWHHIAVTYAGANGAIAFYFDGADDSTPGPWTSNFVDTAVGFSIGADNVGGSEFLSAALDDLAFYSVALSAAQIKDHYLVGTGKNTMMAIEYEDPTDAIAVA